jgi:hypothetical protein
MKALKARIAALGFEALSKTVYACRHGDLVHTVMINKDRYGGHIVSVLVSIPAFLMPMQRSASRRSNLP